VVDYFGSRHDLTVVSFTFSEKEVELAAELRARGLNIHTVPFPQSAPRAWAKRVASLASDVPYAIGLFNVPAMRRRLTSLLAEREFDVVQFDTTFAGSYVDLVAGRAKTVLVEIDFTVKPLARRYQLEQSPIKRAWYRRELNRMRRFEPALCRRFDRVLAVSSEDRAGLLELAPSLPVNVFRYGAEPSLFQLPLREHGEGQVLFIGSYIHPPNVDAATWFARSIFPMVQVQVPAARVTYVGGNPPDSVREAATAQGIHVTGWVADVTPYLARADIGVVPLRSGGGVKLKTLELMAAGKAIVTTAIGIEGIDARDGEHVLVADTAESFATQVVRLLRDDALRARLARNARELAVRGHQWAGNLRELEADYLDLVHGPRRLAARAV
jgi:glycosyltransferase involved in cell wall biosynthesis